PHAHCYMAALPGMWERTISCSSLSKTYSITGWRLGYVIAPPEITDRVRKVHDFLTVGAAAPLMEAAVAGLTMPDGYYIELQEHYTHSRNLFLDGLRNLQLDFTEPQGAYYVMVNIEKFLKKGENDLEFCERLAREVGVGAVPGSSFFREEVNYLVRLHFAKRDETLYEALERLEKLKKG
ncbi:MAG: pyridoxal phosphate-dependent aminotransferase, partial [Lachnospiraceae bacterium]